MRVSIALATFQGEAHLWQQLESIAVQTRPPDELVLTDDSPGLQTIKLAEEFRKAVPFPVAIFHNETRLGYRANFFKAVSRCTGDIVAFCDQDDVWTMNKLERMLPAFEDPDVLLAIHAVQLVDHDLHPLDASGSHWAYHGVYPPLSVDPWYLAHGMSMLVRREIFQWVETTEEAIPGSGPMGHDLWAWFVASSLGKIVGIPETLALYRQHEKNVFGAPEESTRRASIHRSFSTGVAHYLRTAQIAQIRADRMDNVVRNVPDTILHRARSAATYYRTMAARLENRATLYGSSGRFQRLRHFVWNLRSGAYKPVEQGGFGRRALAKDLYLGIMRRACIA